jgi:hypothetical protein
LQIFNFLSCRKVNDELHIFSGLLTNYIFWAIFLFITLFQFSIVFFLNKFFNCYEFHGLTAQQWALSLLFGATVIPLSLLIRLLPFCKPDPLEDVSDAANDLQFRDPEEEECRSEGKA